MDPPTDEESQVMYEELAEIERSFEDVDTQIIGQQYILSTALYAKRDSAIKSIKHFWPLALEQAPVEIDQYIQPSDSEVFASCLTGFSVTRPEIPSSATATSALAELGNPRTVRFRFEFDENEWFENKVLEKTFWYRRSKEGDTALISEPVKIHWKAAKDLSDGLTDAAVALWEKVKKLDDPKKREGLAEYTSLVEKVENSPEGSQSFFSWFGYKGGYVTAKESEAAMKEEDERRAKVAKGEKVEEPKDDEDDEDVVPSTEPDEADIFPMGEELAIALAEDFWPNALKYFTTAQEDETLSEGDFEDMDEDDDDEEPDLIDIRSLVKGSGKDRTPSANPPSKKRKT